MSTAPTDLICTYGLGAEQCAAFEVLVDSVRTLQDTGRSPTASEVRLRMRDSTYGGFDPKKLGYKRFRDFLTDAETHELVVVDHHRCGDVAVSVPGHEPASATAVRRSIRHDLWKAFVDWTPGQLRYYDVARDTAVTLPEKLVPLEPSGFRELRQRLASEPDNFVAIAPVAQATQVGWMRTFAETVPDLGVRASLHDALSTDRPARDFINALKSVPTELRRWYQELHKRVRGEVEMWAASLPTSIDFDREETISTFNSYDGGPGRSTADTSSAERSDSSSRKPSPRSYRVQSTARRGGDIHPTLADLESTDNLRAALHRAIDRMPTEQLRMLPVPVGYLLGR